MSQYKITSSAGVDMGTYDGATPAEALDAMARDAGYKSSADADARGIEPFDGTVTEVLPLDVTAEPMEDEAEAARLGLLQRFTVRSHKGGPVVWAGEADDANDARAKASRA